LSHSELSHNPDYQYRLAALLRAAANDLKRNNDAADADLDLSPGTFADCVSGRAPITWEILRRATNVWPVNERDLLPLHDDCTTGVRLHRAAESVASARLIERGGRPYYEYRDTAMSRLASYRPEWIRMLCLVDDDDPGNALVEWNNGHLLYQFTYFVGPVNYYFRWGDESHCVSMKTGDSVFGVPFAPHSFTTRSDAEPAYILALTYGGDLTGDAQRELAVLGHQKAGAFAIAPNTGPACGQADLLRNALDARAMPTSAAAELAELPAARLEELLTGSATATASELHRLATALSVSIRDLLPIRTEVCDGVRIQLGDTARRWAYPNPDQAAYHVTRLAGDAMHPHTTALQVRVVAPTHSELQWLTTYQHQYLYVLRDQPVQMTWRHQGEVHATELGPGDSAYLTPHTPVAFTSLNATATVLLLRIGGAVTTDVRFALGVMPQSGLPRYVAEDRLWYQHQGSS
jgi:hypothetical protein